MRFKREKFGIYGIFNNDECVYVGRGDLQDRKHYHWSRCRNGKHKNLELQECWDSNDGENTFEFRVLEYCLKKEFKEKEQYYIDLYKPLFNKIKAGLFRYNTNTNRKQKVREHRSEINSGENNPRAKYTLLEIERVKFLFADGVDIKKVSEETGISREYLYLIKSGRRWKHVNIENLKVS